MADEYEEAALIYLEKTLVHDGNDDVRAAAAEEIGELESERGIEVLAKGLNDPDEDVRETVVEALGEIGGKSALPLLREALKDGNEDIREAAADLIEEIEEDEKETE
jgi:HEAT repeat protein